MLGPHALKNDVLYMLGCRWDDAKVRKWQEFKAKNGLSTSSQDAASYMTEETASLKKNYGSESHFLIQHWLRIHDEEDCEDGRTILRAVMRAEDEDFDDQEEEFDEDEFEGHQVDYNFTEPQLAQIEKHYRNSDQFMICYGLKFYDDEILRRLRRLWRP
jgi:hypothetical protein